MNGFTADHELLARRAGEFTGLSERADRILTTLSGTLDGHGACWGGDAAGQAFARSHVSPADTAITAISELPDGLRGIGDALARTAATYAESEHTSTSVVRDAGRELG